MSIIQEALLFILSLSGLYNFGACSLFIIVEKYRKGRLTGVNPKTADALCALEQAAVIPMMLRCHRGRCELVELGLNIIGLVRA